MLSVVILSVVVPRSATKSVFIVSIPMCFSVLNVFILNVVILLLSVVILRGFILSVVTPIVVMLGVVAPKETEAYRMYGIH
jgi:hypothetical protein